MIGRMAGKVLSTAVSVGSVGRAHLEKSCGAVIVGKLLLGRTAETGLGFVSPLIICGHHPSLFGNRRHDRSTIPPDTR